MKKIGIVIIIALSLLHSISYANTINSETTVKYVFKINYPSEIMGKHKYFIWVDKVKDTLKSFPEIKNIDSYDNYFGVAPNRIVEFYFDSLESASKYWSRPEVGLIIRDLPNHSTSASVSVYLKRTEYEE